MNMDTQNYYQQAAEWGEDSYGRMRLRSDRIFIFGIAAMVLSCISVLTIATLLPLKTVETVVIEVNRETGAVSNAVSQQDYQPLDKTAEHFIVKYVQYRESYDTRYIDDNYVNVQLMSAPDDAKKYSVWFRDDPASPHRRLRPSERIEAKVKSMNILPNQQVHIRFQTVEILQTGKQKPKHWSAVFDYGFGQVPKEDEYRFHNILGFYVKNYRKDQELFNN